MPQEPTWAEDIFESESNEQPVDLITLCLVSGIQAFPCHCCRGKPSRIPSFPSTIRFSIHQDQSFSWSPQSCPGALRSSPNLDGEGIARASSLFESICSILECFLQFGYSKVVPFIHHSSALMIFCGWMVVQLPWGFLGSTLPPI